MKKNPVSLFLLLIILSSAGFLRAGQRQGQWHPEKNYWPRALIDSSQVALELVRSRILFPPFDQMYQQVSQAADQDYAIQTTERKKAWIAKNAAFRFLMDEDQYYADKALDYLLVAQREPYSDLDERYGNLIWDAEILTNLLLAYDFLKGGIYDFAMNESEVRANLIDITVSIYQDTDWWIFELVDGLETNYGAKMAGAVGLAAVIFNDNDSTDPDRMPLNWINFSVQTLWQHLTQYQVDENGGWAEGPYYLRFSAQSFLPFMIAQSHFLNGQTGEYGSLTLPPLIQTQELEALIDWGIRVRLPNGFRPNFDDSYLDTNFYSGMLGNFLDLPYLNWDFASSSFPYNTSSSISNFNVEVICTWNDQLPVANEPDLTPTQFLPQSGQIVFRSDWTENAVYGLLLGEHGLARTGGRIHEHPDNTSFLIAAYGELLVMDSGYISWDQHDLVRFSHNHNLILIDGEGPPAPSTLLPTTGTDSYIENTFATSFLDYGEVSTGYQDTEVTRTAAFYSDRIFIINDFTDNQGLHDYEWLLHGNGGGTTGNSTGYDAVSAFYEVNNVSLTAYFNSSEDLVISQYDDYHEVSYDNPGTHTVTRATAQGEDVFFSVVLIPDQIDADYQFSTENGAGFISSLLQGQDILLKTVVKNDESFIVTEFDDKEVGYDGHSLVLGAETSGWINLVFARKATRIDLDGFPLFQAQAITDICLNIHPDSLEVYIGSGGLISIYTGNEPEQVQGAEVMDFERGSLTLDTQADSYFSVEVDWELALLRPEIRSITREDNSVTLSWYPTAGAETYQIYGSSDNSDFELIATTADTTWTRLTEQPRHYFYIKAQK